MERHALRDDQFARIEHLLPGRPGTVGRNSDLGNRLFVDAVIWKFRVGVPWRDLPERFGGWCNTHKRFSRWAVTEVPPISWTPEHLCCRSPQWQEGAHLTRRSFGVR
jgi:transposase